jgi:hypothetical protein
MADNRIPRKAVSKVLDFLQKTALFDPYFQVIGEEESSFIKESGLSTEKADMCAILAAAEKDFFESRATSLERSHPLAVQVQLKTGLANGVLVVRSEPDCARLLEQLLTNSCEFTFDSNREKGVLCLVEKVTTNRKMKMKATTAAMKVADTKNIFPRITTGKPLAAGIASTRAICPLG